MSHRFISLALLFAFGCGGSDDSKFANSPGNTNTGSNNFPGNNLNNVNNRQPEVERFLVREIASTDTYVFVPNASEESASVARVDARDLSVLPLRVGLNPTDVVAADIEGIGAVAYVLCEGNHTVAVIRADEPSRDGNGIGDVRPLEIPREINRLTMTPSGRSVIAWIDPERELDSSSVASLQVLALVRLGDASGEDEVFQLSVTRIIRDIEFTETGELFLLGREGVNRIVLDEVTGDTFIPKLDLGLDADLFRPEQLEMEVAPNGQFLIIRDPSGSDIALYDLTAPDFVPVQVALPGVATDIDLVETTDGYVILATVSSPDSVSLIDPIAAFADPDNYIAQTTDISAAAGLAQITPDQTAALVYSTIPEFPTMTLLDLTTLTTRSWPLRNNIASVSISANSKTAIVVHTPNATELEGSDGIFQSSNGLTLIDLATGFLRPIVLQGGPTDLVVTQGETSSLLYALLDSTTDGKRGVMRINLDSFRSDFIPLPKQPAQIGRVGDQIFVSQESAEGRITFLDLNTQEQRTVSGYELNAIID